LQPSAKKKKWTTKGKSKDKITNKVVIDQAVYDAMVSNVPNYKLITVAIVSERLKVNGSVARVGIRHLEEEGKIKRVDKHGSVWIYTKA
jgi:small subunit ribosomal protein S25e